MSTYGLKYSQYLEQGGVRLQIKVYVKDYSGASYGMAHITGASLQIVGGQSDVLSPVLKTAFSWSMADCWDEGTTRADGTTCVDATGQKCGKWEEFYTNDATKFKVELSVLPDGGTAAVIWTGFVTQDSWSESLVYRGSVTITARDMLGALQDTEFNLTGRVSVLDIVQGALSACACPMALSYTAGHFLVNSNGSDILAHTVAASTFAGDNWQTVLEDVLESLGLVLRYNGANGIVLTSYRYIKADTLLGTHGCEFISRSGLRSLNPALKEITETFDVDVVEVATPDPSAGQFAETGSNLTQKIVAHLSGGGTQTSTNYIPGYTLALSGDEGWAGSLGVPAIGTPKDGAPDRGIYFPTDIEEAAEASLTLPRMRGYFAFKIEQDGGLVEIAGQAGALVIRPCTSGHSVSEVRVRVEAVVDGVTKYLTASGSWDTTSTDFGVAIGQEIIVPDSGAVGAKVVIVKVITENTMPAYFAILAALRVAISPGADGASIISEYKTTTIYNEENNVTISRSPKIGSAGIGGCVDFYENVLSLGDSVAPDEWNWGGESSYYPLAVMIHAQILVYNAAAASVFTGTMHDTTAGLSASLPGYGITYYQRDCVPINATYDFVSGFVVQTTLREVYTWAQVWGSSFAPQYTRKSGSGRGSTSAAGAGGASVTPGQDSGASSGAGGVNYFEPDAGFPGGVALKGQYNGLRVPGIRFGAGADSFDLYVDTVQDSGGNPVRVLRTPLPLFTGGDQIIGDGTPGSGGGGGGASYIYELKDTLSSWIGRPSVSETQVLVFDPSSNVHDKNGNNGAWKYVNASSIGGVTSVVEQTGVVTAEQIATALTSAGYKLTDHEYTNGYGLNLSNGEFSLTQAVRDSLGLANTALQAASIKTLTLKVGTTTIGSAYNPIGSSNQTLTIAESNLTALLNDNYHPLYGEHDASAEKYFWIGGAKFIWHPAAGGTDGYLELQSAIVTTGDQIVNSGTPGGGGSGGGAGYLYELGDIYHDNAKTVVLRPNGQQRDNGDVLSFDSALGVWVALQKSSLLSGYALESYVDSEIWDSIQALNLGTASTYGVGTVASGNGGLVTGGSVYSAINDAVSSALKFQGITTTAISDGSTTNPIVINGASYTAKKGDVVLYDGREFLWTGSAWEQLGDEVSWALKTTTISAGTGLTGGGTLAANRTISLNSETIASLALADTAYQKPSTGIPKGDLASGVQTSLGLADTAYQKPSGGIPNSDIATPWVKVGTTQINLGGQQTSLAGLVNVTMSGKLTIGDAEIEWIPNSGNGYLKINKPLLTVGDQIVNSGTPGGGGGGGGAGFLYELGDVLTDSGHTVVKQYDGSTNAANNNLFAFNGSKWYALKLGTNLSITNGTLNATDTTYSNGTGLALSNGVFSIASAYQGYITHGESAYNSLGNYVLKAGDSMTGSLAICLTPSSSYPVDRTKATLIVEDDNEAATGEVRGGNIILSRGYTATANQSAGAISFYGRRISAGYRNGARIASISSVTGTSYDKQDLVFYVSNNESDSTPTFEEAMRIRADKAVSMNGWLSVSRDGVYNVYTNNTASGGTATGIRFQLSGTTKGGLFVSSDENLYYSVGTASTGNKVLTSANYDGFALPLAGGTMTGSIKLTNGTYINAESGYAMCGVGESGTTFYCGPGAEITSQFLLRSGNIDLTHHKAGTPYKIWDASNSNLSTVDWAAKNLSVAGTSSFSDTMYVENRTYMYWKDSGGTSRNIFGLNNTDSLLIGYGLTSVTGSVVAIYGETVRLQAANINEIVKTGGATLVMRGTQLNSQVHTILFRGNDSESNGFKIQTTAASSYGRQSLGFYRSNVTSGSSPYTPVWKRSLYMPYDGGVIIGTSSDACNLTVYGSITSTGDQVISSDASLKKNWRDLKYGVADIAKATAGVFDWKDGKGESAGTKAQDWMHLVPQLVHGEEGHMTLAYGQIAMLNTILLARRSEDHETRIKALELENAELRKEIERLMS